MSYIDVAIPAIIGLVALVRPQLMFYGSRATPDEKKIRVLRGYFIYLPRISETRFKISAETFSISRTMEFTRLTR